MHRLLVSVVERDTVRVALVNGRQLLEYQVERDEDRTLHGSVYLARVMNVEPGIQAAFLDIGEERSAFLHVSDVHHAYAGASDIPFDRFQEPAPDRRKKPLIQDILHRGQRLMVQISKEAIGHKGPSVTTFISLPGRYVVLMVGMSRAGVSKKIEDPEQRDHLREMAESLDPGKSIGLIVRTAGVDQTRADLARDLKLQKQIWQGILDRLAKQNRVGILYEESGVVLRTIRDLFSTEFQEILVDSERVAREIREFMVRVMPKHEVKVRKYSGSTPLFEHCKIESEIEGIYDRKVPMASGASLVIDETEALVAIDVNSGRYRAQDDLEKTALEVNIEATREIARQLRLRDIGGVVVCDFIDMTEPRNRRKVEVTLREELRHDRAKTWFSRMSRFGIIEMTRQRLRPSKDRVDRETCPTCQGRGTVRSARSHAGAVLAQVERAVRGRNVGEVVVHAGERVLDVLVNQCRESLVEVEERAGTPVTLRPGDSLAGDEYTVEVVRKGRKKS